MTITVSFERKFLSHQTETLVSLFGCAYSKKRARVNAPYVVFLLTIAHDEQITERKRMNSKSERTCKKPQQIPLSFHRVHKHISVIHDIGYFGFPFVIRGFKLA